MTVGFSGAGFDIDLREGQKREDALAYVLRLAKVELKCDRMCRQTGNVFVELQQKGRWSGLATTESEFWAFEIDDQCWLIVPTAVLRDIVRLIWRENRARGRKAMVSGGDFNRYKGVLVPIARLVYLFNAVRGGYPRVAAEGGRQ